MQHPSEKYYGTSPLSRALESVTKPAFKQRGFAGHRIITDWAKIVGNPIGRYSAPQKLVFPPDKKEKGVLYVEVYDSAFATEIHYLGPIILEKIATYFGYQAVERLQIIQKPMVIEEEVETSAPVNDVAIPELAGIADLEMQEALQALGRYIVCDRRHCEE